jgi:hypothetical protein
MYHSSGVVQDLAQLIPLPWNAMLAAQRNSGEGLDMIREISSGDQRYCIACIYNWTSQ